MGLTKAQATIWQRVRSLGNGAQAIGLTNECCAYLIGRIVQDLSLVDQFPEFSQPLPSFFSSEPLENLVVTGLDAKAQPTETIFAKRRHGTTLRCAAVDGVRDSDFAVTRPG